jgi:hypothetical protein
MYELVREDFELAMQAALRPLSHLWEEFKVWKVDHKFIENGPLKKYRDEEHIRRRAKVGSLQIAKTGEFFAEHTEWTDSRGVYNSTYDGETTNPINHDEVWLDCLIVAKEGSRFTLEKELKKCATNWKIHPRFAGYPMDTLVPVDYAEGDKYHGAGDTRSRFNTFLRNIKKFVIQEPVLSPSGKKFLCHANFPRIPDTKFPANDVALCGLEVNFEVMGWQSIHLNTFRVGKVDLGWDEAMLDKAYAGLGIEEEDLNLISFELECRKALVNLNTDGMSLFKMASRLPAESVRKILADHIGDIYLVWSNELLNNPELNYEEILEFNFKLDPDKPGGKELSDGVTLFCRRIAHCGRLLAGCGVPVMKAFEKVQEVGWNARVNMKRLHSITDKLTKYKRINDNDLVVLDWIGLFEEDKKEREAEYGDDDTDDEEDIEPGMLGQIQMQGRTVDFKATEILYGRMEASNLDEYCRLVDFPRERRTQYVGKAYKKFIMKMLEEADEKLPTLEMSNYWSEAAAVVGLSDEAVEKIHDKKFRKIFEGVIKASLEELNAYEGEALLAKAEEKISKFDEQRVIYRMSKRLLQVLITERIEFVMKPAVDKLLEGCNDSKEGRGNFARKVGYTSGPAHRAATYKLLDLASLVKDFTDLPSFNLTFNFDVIKADTKDGEQHWEIYWYVVRYGEGMEIGNRLAEEVFGMTSAEREFVLQTECGKDIMDHVWKQCSFWSNTSAEKCKGLWEPFGLEAKWVDDYIWDYQVMWINEVIFKKLRKAEDVNLYLCEHILDGAFVKHLRKFTDEVGANILENVSYRDRERLFWAEVQSLVNNDQDLNLIEDIATAYGVDDSRSQTILTACLQYKQDEDDGTLEDRVLDFTKAGFKAMDKKVTRLNQRKEIRNFNVRNPLNIYYPAYPEGVKSAIHQSSSPSFE